MWSMATTDQYELKLSSGSKFVDEQTKRCMDRLTDEQMDRHADGVI